MEQGLDAQRNIFAINPDDRRAFEALEEQFFLDGDWESLVELYHERIKAPTIMEDDEQRAPLLFRLGQILEERVIDLDAASEVYWTLARLDPSNRPALQQLRGIHERSEKWDMVLQIAELESATSMPPYDRAAFETDLGKTWQKHLGDSEEATRAYERALEADPEFPAALEGLADIHLTAGRIEEAADIFLRLTARLRGPERAPAWISLGTLYVNQLEQPERARECFNAALDDDPFQPAAVEWALLLATVEEDWDAVSDLLESRFDLASGARHRAAVAVEASQIQLHHQGSEARARAWTNRAVELAPDEISVLLAVAEVERADNDRATLLETLDQLIANAGKDAPRSALVEAAELHSEFGHADLALEAIRRASERRGHDDGQVLTIQARLLREAGSKRELAEVLETLTALEEEGEHLVEWLCELARLQEEDLAEPTTAEANWQRAFDLNPAHTQALDALERISRKRDDWRALRETFETALNSADESATVTISAKLGVLLLEHFEEEDRARSLFDAALAEEPDCRVALGGMRRIAENSNDPDLLLEVCESEARGCQDGEQMAELAQTAIPILRARDRNEDALSWAMRWSKAEPEATEAFLLRAEFEARLSRAEDEIESRRKLSMLLHGQERCESLRRQATLHIELDDDDAAAIALERTLEDEPNDRETLETLCTVYRRLDRAQQLVQCLRTLVDELPAADSVEPLEELAATLQDPIGDLDAAIVVRWQLADLPSAPEDANAKLDALLEMAGRYAELAQLLDTRRQLLGDESEEAFALDQHRGRILLDSLGQSEEAAEIFSALHERHPDDEEILDQLERALRVGNDAQGLCDLIERRASWETDESTRSAMHLERASLLEESLGEPVLACDLYEEIIETDADTANTATAEQRLESLLDSSGQWERLRDRLAARVGALPEEEQATLRERIAAICRDRLQDISGYAEQLEAIAEIVTDRVHVWQQLGDIYGRDLDRPGDWLRVVEAELESQPDIERERSLRVAAARLYLDDDRRPKDRDASMAFSHFERILEIDPAHAEAAEVLATHYSAEGRLEETVRVLEARLGGLSEAGGAETNDLRLRLAVLLSTSLESDERARVYFEAARAELGVAPRVADPLADLYLRIGAFEQLSQLCHEALEANEGSAEQQPWRLRLGESEAKRGLPNEAAAAYRSALEVTPDDREIEDALIGLYQEINETDPLAALLEKRLRYAPEEELIDLRMRLARLHSEDRHDPIEALDHLEWILESHPQHRDAFDFALSLAEQVGDGTRILGLLDRALSISQSASERAATLERRGLLLANELARPEEAVVNLREALALDRGRPEARRTLRRELEGLNRWPAVLDCLYIEATDADPERRVELLEEANEIAWERINPDASLPWLARLRAERPSDPDLLSRLADVHQRAGRFEAALRAHDEELLLRSTPARKHDIHMRRAGLLERDLHSPGRAIFAYQRAMEFAEDKNPILLELDRLYDTLGRPFERADVLESRVAALDDAQNAEQGIELRQALASLYCVDLAKPELALPHLQANVAATRGDINSELAHLRALDAALRASTRHDQWALTAERELELIEGDDEIHASTPKEYLRYLREELARAYDQYLGNPDRAIEHLRILCDGHETADDPSTLRAKDQLLSLLRRTGRAAELAIHLAQHLEAERGAGPEWLELARVREEKLADLVAAREAYERAESHAGCELDAIRGRRRCCERLRDWEGMIDALEAEYALDEALDLRERTTIASTIGDICWLRLASAERAIAGYELALEHDPKSVPTLQSLIRVKEASLEGVGVIPLYQRELELLADEPDTADRRTEIWLRLATLHRRNDASSAEAIDAYNEAAAIDRLSPDDELALAWLYHAAEDAEAFAETFGSWCDRDDSAAEVSDHLELARQLSTRGESDAALDRAERATSVAPTSADAWALLAELQIGAEENEKASEAYERAANHADPEAATGYLVLAATTIQATDLARANDILLEACELDTADIPVRVALTRVSSERECYDETLCEADAALELSRAKRMDLDLQLEMALLGGRAARHLDDRDASRRLFEIALGIDPDQVEALEGKADAHFQDGDYHAARGLLERRLEQPGENPDKGRQHSMVARSLEAEDLLDAAWARYEEAIDLAPNVEEAHEGLVRVLERADRTQEALTALERWADTTSDSETKALASFRAAEHALALEDGDRALDRLEVATGADPQLAPAWLLRCQLVGEEGVDTESRRLCEEALEAIEPGPVSAQISRQIARLLEIAGDNAAAIERYAEASRWEPRFGEAVLSESRLIRMAGDWVEADAVLARFIDAHPEPKSPELSHVYLERGRLLSGPLEAFEDAIAAYETALELQPELAVARTALAGLLLHSADRWRDSLKLHREILDASPTTTVSLRAIARLAEQRDQLDTAEAAMAVLRALGQASPQETDTASGALQLAIRSGPPMLDDDDERLRSMAQLLSEELRPILVNTKDQLPDELAPEVREAIEQITQIEDEMSAPGLTALDCSDRAALFTEVAALFLDPDGDGEESRYRDVLDPAIGRWTRRKIRRMVEETSVEAIAEHDHETWGHEMRALAAAQALDRNGGDLRSVLRAMLYLENKSSTQQSFEGAEIATLAATSEATRRLLTRITQMLCERLERAR